MENLTKSQIKRRKRKAKAYAEKIEKERQMEQLASAPSIPAPNYNNPTVGKIIISKEKTIAEVRTRKWMDLKRFEALINPEGIKKRELSNTPRSTFNKLQTAHQCQKDKLPPSIEAWKYKCRPQAVRTITIKNPNNYDKPLDVPLIEVLPQILPKRSPTAGMKRISWRDADKKRSAFLNRDIDKIDLKEPKIEEKDDRIQHELK